MTKTGPTPAPSQTAEPKLSTDADALALCWRAHRTMTFLDGDLTDMEPTRPEAYWWRGHLQAAINIIDHVETWLQQGDDDDDASWGNKGGTCDENQ